MHRRNFLLSGLGAAALRADDERVSIGFIGAGHAHGMEKVRLVSKSPRFRVVGVAEEDSELVPAIQALGLPIVPKQRLLEDPSIRAIAVESQVRDHARHGREAVEAGKHLHIEKAAAGTVEEFRDILAIAARKRLLVQSGYIWRLHPGFQAAFEAVRKGWLGQVYLIRGIMNTQVPDSKRALFADFPGGQMFELAGHLIDPIVRMFGRPERVTPFLRHDSPVGDTLRDNTLAVLEFKQTMALVSSATMQPHASPHRSFEILGSNGTLVMEPIEPASLRIDLQSAAGPYQAGVQTVELPPFRRYIADLEEFALALRDGKPLAITPEQELLVHETLLRACAMA
ncbi:MAG: Gfo/Idh/MocA family oxidoreductase [Acidobacteria bacterium]|nr:Gfo/Idh/MocA family oxidoreductase [Acidobacteriota bacterium]